jgi:hypothetical protein
MKQYKAINQGVEVNGQTILSFVDALGSMRNIGFKILSEKGIDNPQKGEWYPQQKWLDAFTYISSVADSSTLYEIGSAIFGNAQFPPEISNINQALESIDVAYHLNHRLNGEVLFNEKTGEKKEGIGNYFYKVLDNKKIEIICDNPYPCDFDRGIIYSMAKKFKPEDAYFVKVEHDKESSCREKEDKYCSYIITW